MRAFLGGDYTPHGYCLLWQPALIWTHVISDAVIALAYFSIPLALIHLVRSRKDLEFSGLILLFALFILACGSTHLMSIWTLWHGDYGIEALVKAFTAAVSALTAVLLWPLIPKAIALPSPAQLHLANEALAARIAERDTALARLRKEVAQREQAEAALLQSQKMEAIGQLTGGIAHDFNNLLQAVSGNLELIQQQPGDPDRVARWAKNAIAGIDRGTRLTGQLLTFSRTQRLELKAVDVGQLMMGILDLLHRSLGPTITLRTEIADDAGCVLADPDQLELAILNIAINARDAMPEGGTLIVAIRRAALSGHDQLPDGDYVDLTLSDTGAGIPPEILPRVIEPFFTTKDVGKGTGLGLSMAYGVARQAGGALEIRSTPGEGTTVGFLLRLVDRGALATPDPAEPSGVPSSAARTRIAVVDDDDGVREIVREALERAGHELFVFRDGAAALRALDEVRPALLIADFAMPLMTGAELARQVQMARPETRILIISGHADSDALDAVFGGDIAMLRKPFAIQELLALVARELRDRG